MRCIAWKAEAAREGITLTRFIEEALALRLRQTPTLRSPGGTPHLSGGEPIGVSTQAGIAFLRLCTKPLARADKDQAAASGLARSVSWSMAQAVLPDAKIFAELNFRS